MDGYSGFKVGICINQGPTKAKAGAVSLRHGRHSRPRRPWYLSPDGFRDLRLGCLLSREACAGVLGCSVRTVRAWDAGARRVPWSAVKLLRLLRCGDIGALRPEWHGWTLNRNGMVSPEGVAYSLGDLGWWSLTCRQAEAFRRDRSGRQRGGGAAVPEPLAVSVRSLSPVGEPPAGSAPRPDDIPPTAPAVPPESVSEGVDGQPSCPRSERQRAPRARGLSITQQVRRERGKVRRGKACSGGPLRPFPAPRQGERNPHPRPRRGSGQREGGGGRA